MSSPSIRHSLLPLALACACLALLATAGAAAAQAVGPSSGGGVGFQPPPPPPAQATIVDGVAIAPAGAPRRVQRVISAANRLLDKPYRYGGGHRPFGRRLDTGYDCSGSVSYALYGGRFLRSPLPSGAMMSWGREGPGDWITVYAHRGHAYLVVAGLRFDTSLRDADAPGPSTGPRWSKTLRKSAAFVARHPRNY